MACDTGVIWELRIRCFIPHTGTAPPPRVCLRGVRGPSAFRGPCDRTVGSHPAQSGGAGKGARGGSGRPGEAFTQPNPTQPNPTPLSPAPIQPILGGGGGAHGAEHLHFEMP